MYTDPLLQHFVCARCEKPFLGNRHYEKKNLAYCETHYHQLFGNLCFVCNQVIAGDGKNASYVFFFFFCDICGNQRVHEIMESTNFLRYKFTNLGNFENRHFCSPFSKNFN